MSNKTISMTDKVNHFDKILMGDHSSPRKTRIIIKDHDTGEVLGEYHNKVLVPGSQLTACKEFGLDPEVNFPTYNTELGLQNSKPPYPETQPINQPIVCLWCAGKSGAGSSANEINVVSITDRIDPGLVEGTLNKYTDIVPFRYVTKNGDLDRDERDVYFGRKVYDEGTASERYAYFFKAFDTDPVLHVRYLDGTEVTDKMYTVDSSQEVEIYVEMRLSVTRQDFRDYFDDVTGWGDANISTISLLTGWYDNTICENPEAEESDRIYYKWYQDVLPFSKFNFGQEQLSNLNRALDMIYQVYY
jgi:hypothetical protein